MADMVPANARPAGYGHRPIWSLVIAAVYLLLVPVIAAVGLSLGATYFPGPTRALLGPALEALVGRAAPGEDGMIQEALNRTAVAEERLSKIERDIAALAERAAEAAEQPSQGASESRVTEAHIAAAIAPTASQAAGRDRMLAGLTALTLARAEFLAGNRAVVERELKLAQECLALNAGEGSVETPEPVRDALGKALDAVQRGASTAGDYLSLAWHLLADALLSIQ